MERLQRSLWHPTGWWAFQFVEAVAYFFVVWWIVPSRITPAAWFAVFVASMVGLTAFNLWLRRRLLPPDSAGDPLGASAR